MFDRETEIIAFLAAAGWGDAARVALAADASARSYQRLSGPRGKAVLMNAPVGGDQLKSAAAAAYNRTAHLAERKIMMQRWADYLDELRAGAKIIRLHGG